jgi:lysophospholipid acyltransferase (LPLAT)-like uncharacterized protein
MKALRRRFASLLGSPLASHVLYTIIIVLRHTMRVFSVGDRTLHSFAEREEVYIGMSWHGRMLMLPFIYPGKRLNILISTHRDGEIIANVMKRFGYELVRGSSSKGGAVALRELINLLKQGSDIGITPDGPKGPPEIVKGGVAQIARLSGKAVIPFAFSSSMMLRFRSWDRFLLPLPFSRLVFVIGDPLYYEKDEDIEHFRNRIEIALNDATSRADAFFD